MGGLVRAVNAAYALRAAEAMTKPPAWLAAAKARVEAQEKQDQDRKAARAKKRAAERAKKEAPAAPARAPARTKEDFAARLDAALSRPARRETDASTLPRLTPRSDAAPEPVADPLPEQLAGTAAELEAVAVAPTADDALDRAALDALRLTELITGTAAAVAELDEEALDREAAEALAENERLRAEYGSDDEDEEEVSSPGDIMQWLQDVIDDQPSRDPRIAEAWAAFEKEDGALSTDRMPDKAAIEAAERALDEEAARAAGVEVDGVLDDDDEDDDAAAAALERKLDRHLARSVENRLDDMANGCRARSKAARARAENAAKARRKASPGPFLTAVDDDDDDGPTRPVTPRTAWVAELRSACDEGRSRIASRRAELGTRPP